MSQRPSARPFAVEHGTPRSRVAQFAHSQGWRFGRRNLLVEGTSDVALFQLASDLYEQATGACLIADDFRVIAAGLREQGGVGAVERKFFVFYELNQADSDLPKSERVLLLPLLDDDDAGRSTFRSITQQRHPFKEYVDVFLLKRRYPPIPLRSNDYLLQLKHLNRGWEGMDCETEDLLEHDFLRAFHSEHPSSLHRQPVVRNGGHHMEWTRDGKSALHQFARRHAMLSDVMGLVTLLRYMRWIFHLPHGEPAPISRD
jgi:hypothetical protein